MDDFSEGSFPSFGMGDEEEDASGSKAQKKGKKRDLSGNSWYPFGMGGDQEDASGNKKLPKVKPLILNPSDLLVDDSLPAYSSPLTLSFSQKPPPSDEDVAAATPLREAARKKVLDRFNAMIKQETFEKTPITQEKWNAATPQQQQWWQTYVLDLFKLPQYRDLLNYVKTELVWWNNNIELTSREVNTRDMKYDQTLAIKQNAWKKAIQEILQKSQQTSEKQQQEAKKKKEAAKNRKVSDDVWDSLKIIFTWIFVIIYIIIGIRCASLAANEVFYKPLPYRILTFVYAFIFTPVVAPYYLWKVIARYVWPSTAGAGASLPFYESMIPMNPYDPLKPEKTFGDYLFGYKDTPEVDTWVSEKKAAEIAAATALIAAGKGVIAKMLKDRGSTDSAYAFVPSAPAPAPSAPPPSAPPPSPPEALTHKDSSKRVLQ